MASVAITEQSKLVYTGAQGPLHPEEANKLANEYTFYPLGTFSALFTKLVAQQLVENNHLNPNDSISGILPAFTWDTTITVQQLLDHSSGIGDYMALEAYVGLSQKWHSNRELVKLIQTVPPMFETGTQRAYSYSNAVLLAIVLETVTGKDIATLYNTYLLEGNTAGTCLKSKLPDPSNNQAGSFRYDDGSWSSAPLVNSSFIGPSGGALMQAKDIAAVMSAVFQYKYFHPNQAAEYMQDQQSDANLLRRYTLNNKIFWGWEGAINGSRIIAVVQPENLRTITICAQGVNTNLEAVVRNLDLLLDGEDFYDPEIAPRTLKGGEAVRYTGLWKNRQGKDKLEIDLVDGHLLLTMEDQAPFPLFPASDQRFTYPNYGVSVTFNKLTGDNYNELVITQGSKRITFER